ncbi:hypothetical protein PPERSA_00656 [Pseudocohnilembus persalinus]|uniref:Acyl-CoA N-acyltransferase n=1 Tax=Pseudocohnilembus persalinus TaxID=266149 RepID=A0A0V0QT55_PSEPJ|nr:hypothetical protein PPERSA_00656 [Pseudocohnilembus persalinus]|eukprot:KRX05355.1 hypothetical protein PPERSA_00656 [Pseudocohnilembus persalinus]
MDKTLTKDLDQILSKFKVEQMQPKYIDAVTDLCVESYFKVTQFYQLLGMSENTFREEIKRVLKDKNVWNLSFVVIKKNSQRENLNQEQQQQQESQEKIVAAKIVRDFTGIHKQPIKVKDQTLQFKLNLEYLMFRDELEKQQKYGQVCNSYMTVVDLKYYNFGLGKLLSMYFVKMMYEMGYKRDVSLIFDLYAAKLCQKTIGGIKRSYDLTDMNIQGKLLFKDYNQGAVLYVSEFSDINVAKAISAQYVKNVKKTLQNKMRQYKNQYSMLYISPKL